MTIPQNPVAQMDMVDRLQALADDVALMASALPSDDPQWRALVELDAGVQRQALFPELYGPGQPAAAVNAPSLFD